MTDFAWLFTAATMGLLGGTHCVGMCGGLSGAFTFALPADQRQGWRLLLWQLVFNSGRLLTYTLLGLTAGYLLVDLQNLGPAKQIIRIIAGVFMILMGAYMAGWFLALAQIERLGGPLWKALAPIRQRMFPVRHPGHAIAAGMIWGLLPCGLVYSAMTLAITRADPSQSALVMLAFGLGTLPTLLLTGTAAGQIKRVLQRPGTRKTAGLLIILFGLWTLLGTQMHSSHQHSGHAAGAVDHEMPAMDHDMSGMDHDMPHH